MAAFDLVTREELPTVVIHETMWEVYLSDPKAEPDPAKWKTEIFWPVA